MTTRVGTGIRVLTLSTVDITLEKLLKGILFALREEGYISEAACANGPHAQQFRDRGVPVHELPLERRLFTLSHLHAFVRLYLLLRTRRFDIVHVHTPFAQVIGRIAAKLAGVPVLLYTSHGFQFHESRPRWARWAIVQLERFLGRWTDIIFTQSLEDAETAVRAGLAPRERVIWIGNGIELDRFSPGSSNRALRAELGLAEGARVVGFVGRVVREKGVVELINAMAEVVAIEPTARLLVVGDTLDSDGDPEVKELVRAAIAENGLDDACRFVGLREDVPALLREMELFVLPSWREGMPRCVIEAMASGLPVVASDIRGCREEVVDGVTGLLVPPRQPARLAAAILQVLNDRDAARKMGRRGRARAMELFDERKVVERQLTVYRRLVAVRRLPFNPAENPV